MSIALDLTLVIDIGKTNAKLLLLDDSGTVVERHSSANTSVPSPLGYPALNVHGLQAWMQVTLRASPNARRCGHAIASTHGAAMVALSDAGLAWEPLDYEYEEVAREGMAASAFAAACDSFGTTLSPNLPAGLNAARQLFWLQDTHPDAWRRTHCLLPYAQYWAWLLCGVAASEVSSLGCHTHLWNPVAACFSDMAVARGWASLFAPVRSAWEVLGTVQPEAALAWGLPPGCQVHVGVHDSNACLARYLKGQSAAGQTEEALTIVSSGTWTVLMAPGAPIEALRAEKDMLGNVDVCARVTPTARFMGGREFAAILGDAEPETASLAALQSLVASHTYALPSFAQQGGPFAGRQGCIERNGLLLQEPTSSALPQGERATLAALYCAQVTAWLIEYLWARHSGAHRVVVEGPLARNQVYMTVLQALLPDHRCYASTDVLEGTARGAWMLSRWHDRAISMALEPVKENAPAGLQSYHRTWCSKVL